MGKLFSINSRPACLPPTRLSPPDAVRGSPVSPTPLIRTTWESYQANHPFLQELQSIGDVGRELRDLVSRMKPITRWR